MKKLILVMFICFIAAGSVFALDNVNVGKLPSMPEGMWIDRNYAAIWEFSKDNVRLLTLEEEVIYDFEGEISDFKFTPSLKGALVVFRCDDKNRTYTFNKGIDDTDIVMTIARDWSDEDYEVTLEFYK